MSAIAVLKLSKAGFTDDQVNALAEYFDEQMATKGDIARLEHAIEELRADASRDIEHIRAGLSAEIEHIRAGLSAEIAHTRAGLSAEIARVKADLELKIAGLDVKISDQKAETIKWVAGLLIAQGAAIVALVKFLPGFH